MARRGPAVSPLLIGTSPAVLASAAWGIAFTVLLLGGCVAFGPVDIHPEGVGSALVAAALFCLAVLIAWRDPAARRSIGLLDVVLVLFLVGAGYLGEFRFVWLSDTVAMAGLEGFLAVTALVLLAPRAARGVRPGRAANVGSLGSGGGSVGRAEGAGRDDASTVPGRVLLWTLTGVVAAMLGRNLGAEIGQPVIGVLAGSGAVLTAYVLVHLTRRRRSRRGPDGLGMQEAATPQG